MPGTIVHETPGLDKGNARSPLDESGCHGAPQIKQFACQKEQPLRSKRQRSGQCGCATIEGAATCRSRAFGGEETNSMEYRRLGRAGLRVSVMGLGGNTFGHYADEA